MKKLFLFFIIIPLLMVLISSCENGITPDNDEEAEQIEGEPTETANNPGPAPNSGDGVSDGPGWENVFPEIN